MSARVFASRFRKGAVPVRPSGCLIAPLVLLPGLAFFKQVILALIIAALAYVISILAIAAWRRRRPALLLSEAGAEIDGLPLVPWREVASVRRDPDSRGEPGLVMRLRRPIPLAAPGRTRMSPLWRPVGQDTLLMRISVLEDAPTDVEEAFRYFLPR